MYYREHAPKVTSGQAEEDWFAGATVAEKATQQGFPIFPIKGAGAGASADSDAKYMQEWLASMGVTEFEELHDPRWYELRNLMASIHEGKPIAAPLDIGAADARGVIYGNRAIDTGQRVFWPKSPASPKV
jgi:hypothetical protein